MKKLLLLPLLLLLALPALFGQLPTTNQHVISYIPFTPCVGAPVMFSAIDTSGLYTQAYHYWNFGDGGSAWTWSSNPTTTHTYTAAGTYQVGISAWDSLSGGHDTSYTSITIDSVCANHDNISGKTYYDGNGNGAQDPGEPNWPNRLIQITPGPYYFTSDQNGNFSVNMTPGTYTLSCVPPTYHTVTEPVGNSYTVTSTGSGGLHPGNDFGLTPIANMNDLRVTFSGAPPVPGFTRNYYLYYSNVGTTVLNATLTFDHDGSLTFVSASNSGTHAGNTVTWNLGNLFPGDHGYVNCQLTIPTTAVIGSVLPFVATINPISGDVVPADNVDARDMIVLSSYDPNDKAVLPAGIGSSGDIAPGTRLTYTIRFQNTGTFAATNVVLEDTLDADLDQATLEVIGGSHPFTWHNDFGKLKFDFHNIMLPDSNANEPASHGHVVYKISPKSTLPLGTELTNTAFIYFDFNAPVVTNTTLNTLATPLAVNPGRNDIHLSVAPNPFNGNTTVRFDNPNDASHTLTVRDLSGRVLQVDRDIVGEMHALDGSMLSAGLYLFTLENNAGVVGSGKLIVR
jgi:uncharacterized repeat protein (TIGR01451 family)